MMFITAFISAFLDNVTTMLLVAPVTIEVSRALKLNPLSLMLPEAFASNVGGTATLIGDPPNIMIGSYAHLTFMDFVYNLTIICFIGLGACILYYLWYFKKDYQKALDTYQDAKNRRPTTVPHPLIDLHMGITCYAQGNFEKAVHYFSASLKTAPSLLESRYWLGQCYIKLHDVEKARAEFKAIIGITPDSELGIAATKALDSLR